MSTILLTNTYYFIGNLVDQPHDTGTLSMALGELTAPQNLESSFVSVHNLPVATIALNQFDVVLSPALDPACRFALQRFLVSCWRARCEHSSWNFKAFAHHAASCNDGFRADACAI